MHRRERYKVMHGDWRVITAFSLVLLSWGITMIATIDAIFLAWVMGISAWALMLWKYETDHRRRE